MRADGRFNLFQRMMLRWRELHPYNPVHVVHVPQALDAGRLGACIRERVEALGLHRMRAAHPEAVKGPGVAS